MLVYERNLCLVHERKKKTVRGRGPLNITLPRIANLTQMDYITRKSLFKHSNERNCLLFTSKQSNH